MRKNFGKQPWLYPMPVLIVSAYGDDGTPEAMAIGWCGILDPGHLSLCLMAGHKTTEAILKTGAFVAHVADAAHICACDYVGTVSGKNVPDKVARAGFHAVKSEFVEAPVLQELPVAVECRLEHYDETTGEMIGEIRNVSAREDVLAADGRIDADRFETLTYDPCRIGYRKLGGWAGTATQVCDPEMDTR